MRGFFTIIVSIQNLLGQDVQTFLPAKSQLLLRAPHSVQYLAFKLIMSLKFTTIE